MTAAPGPPGRGKPPGIPPGSRRGRPGEKAASHKISAASTRTSINCLAAWRERHAWARAVLWLHDEGLPAAAPAVLADWLREHGADADWYHRGPCGCGRGECWVLTFGGERPPPEIHLPAARRTMR